MRAPLLLSLLLLFAGIGAAQEIETLRASAEDFPGPVAPLQGSRVTTLRAEASCALFDERASILVGFAVKASPTWANVVVSPAGMQEVSLTSCDQGWVRAEASLVVTATDQAPAFQPATIVVEVVAGSAGRESRKEVEVPLEASYFSVLDTQAAVTMMNVAPGGEAGFEITLTNFGNGPTAVAFGLDQDGDGLAVTLPDPVTLGSKQAGSNDVTERVTVVARVPPQSGFVNRVEVFSVLITSEFTDEPKTPGDSSVVSFIVNVKSAGIQAADERSPTPLPALLALFAVPLAALLRRR